jgi:hypothetical protein
VSTGNEASRGGGSRVPKRKSPVPARVEASPVILRNITDMEFGVTMLTGADEAARRMAHEMCPEHITQQERVAMYSFLQKVASYIRWPGFNF